MPTEQVVGVVPNYAEAMRAVHELQAQGFPEESISIMVREDERQEEQERHEADEDRGIGSLETAPVGAAGAGAATGGALGAAGGLLLGLGALLIPGIGPIMAAGPLAIALGGALAGAATGGLVGALVHMGVPSHHAEAYHRALERGAVIVSVRVDDDEAAEDAAAVLRRYEPVHHPLTPPASAPRP